MSITSKDPSDRRNISADIASINISDVTEALQLLRPTGSILLVSINPLAGNSPFSKSFSMPFNLSEAVKWVSKRNARGENIYFTCNETRPNLNKKAKKIDVVNACMCWADCDPNISIFGSHSAARDYLFEQVLPAVSSTASLVIDSGNGISAFWLLNQAVPLTGSESIDDFERVNSIVGLAFKGPGTQNVDRLMRLPGTLNFPTESKLKKGYPSTPVLSRILHRSESTYSLATVETIAESAGMHLRLQDALHKFPKLRRRWTGDRSGLVDDSDSGMDMSMMSLLRLAGFSFDECVDLLNEWPESVANGRSQGSRYWERIWRKTTPANNNETTEISGANLEQSGITQDIVADSFSEKYRHVIRYVAGWNAWYQWLNNRWAEDSTLEVFDKVRTICRDLASTAQRNKQAEFAKASTIAGIEKLAKADRRHAATTEQWDRNPWLLNTPDSVIDLRTGERQIHRPEDYLTQITAISPGGSCPLWQRTLLQVTDGDEEVVGFLKRYFGYALSGSINEHLFLFLSGSGRNGKGTVINTISKIFGDYHQAAPMETFQASKNERHPTELALLRGARLVTAQETESNRRWNESRIKSLTGGDPITARFMRGDFFTFEPTFKLAIAGNHRPRLSTVDPAMRARLCLVPFDVCFPKDKRDPELGEKLQAEWPGILAWLIEGCLEWQKDGLNPPAKVTSATDDYFDEEDNLQNWIRECCELGTNYSASATELWESWQEWVRSHAEYAGSIKSFSQKLEAAGFERTRSASARKFSGIRILSMFTNCEDGSDGEE